MAYNVSSYLPERMPRVLCSPHGTCPACTTLNHHIPAFVKQPYKHLIALHADVYGYVKHNAWCSAAS